MMFKLGRKNKPTTAVTEDQPQLAVVSWTKGQWLTGMAARVLIWILVLCGALALAGVAYLMTRPAPEAPAATVDPEPDGREAAAELAQRAVKLMLTTTRGDENQVAEVLPRIQLPREAADVTNITTAETTHERGTWVVTVAADVDSIRRYYQVPIAVTDDGMTVLMLPSQVAAPRIAPRPESPYRVQVPSNDPAALAAGEFLGALLAGAGDVARYTSPGSAIQAVTPPPYESVFLEFTQALEKLPETPVEGDEVELYVRARGTTADGQTSRSDYVLTVALRASRWEISAVQGAPALSAAPTTSEAPSEPPN